MTLKCTMLVSLTLIGAVGCSKKSEPSKPSSLTLNALSEASIFKLGENSKLDVNDGKERTPEVLFREAGEKLSATMLTCPERIWPNYNWRDLNVIMVADGSPSFLWRGDTGGLEPLAESDVPSSARRGTFSFTTYKGKPAVSIYVSQDEDYLKVGTQLFKIVVHEGFHMVGQKDWLTRMGGSRSTTLPIESLPRLYRRMLFDRLQTYFHSNGSDTRSRAQAAFWFRKWKSEFPSENLSTTDGYEGTARYVEELADVVAELGCAAKDSELLAKLQQKLGTEPGFSVNGSTFALDVEGYDLGGLAANSLRFIQGPSDWFERMKKGETPVEVLLEGVEPVDDTIPDDLKAVFSKTEKTENDRVVPLVSPALKLLQDPTSIRIVPVTRSREGSYSPMGFFQTREAPGIIFQPLAKPVIFTLDGRTLTADVREPLMRMNSVPCLDNGGFVAITSASSVTGTESLLRVNRPGLNGVMQGRYVTDPSGVRWFCGDQP